MLDPMRPNLGDLRRRVPDEAPDLNGRHPVVDETRTEPVLDPVGAERLRDLADLRSGLSVKSNSGMSSLPA